VAKPKTHFVCQSCGASTSKWQGKCPSCDEWGTLVEERLPAEGGDSLRARLRKTGRIAAEPRMISEIASETAGERKSSGIPDFDRILGGGMVPGSVILLGGPPGVGKSTLALQVAVGASLSGSREKALYISAEESPEQVADRARRLGLADSDVTVLSETELETILDLLSTDTSLSLVIVDSIQTVRLAGLMSAAGTVAQVRECAARITEWAKTTGSTAILVGHVTKEGQLAGPKVLEHLVDVVCYLDEEPAFDLRILRASKNRYGSAGEIGLFEMTGEGILAVDEGALPWLGGASSEQPSIFGVVSSASRSWLTEVQALVTPTAFQYPRRIAIGLEGNRLAMLLAVIEKHLKMPLCTRDVHVNVVGGLRVTDTALDLPIALSVLGSFLDQVPAGPIAGFGEVGLSGEVRRVSKNRRRIAEARRFGVEQIYTGGSEPGVEDGSIVVTTLAEALRNVFDI